MPFGLRGVGFVPTQMNGCVLWLAADHAVISGSTAISLPDLTGNNNNLTAKHGSNPYPQYLMADPNMNGQPSLGFSNASVLGIENVNISIPQPFSLFMVGYTPSGGGTNLMAASRDTDSSLYFTAGGNTYSCTGAGSVNIFPGTAAPTAVCSVLNGASSVNYGNSSSNSATFTNSNALNGLSLGLITGVNFYTCNISEVIVYNRVVTPNQVSWLFQYFASKYNPGAWS